LVYLSKGNNAANHPELLKVSIVLFCPSHTVEPVFSQMWNQWTKHSNRLAPGSAQQICTVQYSFKNKPCEQLRTYIRGVPAILKKN
jgi:hypothetical protein